jgi:hypothetical protein
MNINRFNQLLESKIGDIKPILVEDELKPLPQPKVITKAVDNLLELPYQKLSILQPSQDTIKTNQNLLNQLQLKNILPKKLDYNANDKDFITRLSNDLKKLGFKPSLKAKKGSYGNQNIQITGFQFSIPSIGLNFQINNNYFGVTEKLPFMKNTSISAGYDTKDKNYSAGFKIQI